MNRYSRSCVPHLRACEPRASLIPRFIRVERGIAARGPGEAGRCSVRIELCPLLAVVMPGGNARLIGIEMRSVLAETMPSLKVQQSELVSKQESIRCTFKEIAALIGRVLTHD